MRELVEKNEVHHLTEDLFLYNRVIYREKGQLYKAKCPDRWDVDVEKLVGERIPLEKLNPTLPDDLKNPHISTNISHPDIFLKTVAFSKYDPDDPAHNDQGIGRQLLRELRVYERIREAGGHPNICEYYGCTLDEKGALSGLCLKRYSHHLAAAGYSGKSVNEDTVIDDCKKGLAFLHSLGLVHNDISPTNIMIGERGQGILIDFGLCCPEGDEVELHTPDYSHGSDISKIGNDYFSLNLVEKWFTAAREGNRNIKIDGM